MNLTPRYQRRSAQVKLTAMIDVVFLLIIFFMTVSQIDREVREELPLPNALFGQEVLDQEGRLVINVNKDGGVIVAKKARELSALQELLEQQLSVRGGSDELVCVLRIHQQTPFPEVQSLLGCLARSGVWQIRFSVVEESL